MNRGNNGADVFGEEGDQGAFLEALERTRGRYPFRLYGYCLMTNHFHLLLKPDRRQSISRILQSLTVAHTSRYHKGHGSMGHVWQGRFKSPVIQDDGHLLVVLRYIEANPLRAGLVSDLARYRWSSFPAHGHGQPDPLLDSLPEYEGLGRTPAERQARWRQKVLVPQKERELAAVRDSVRSGRPLGEPDFVTAHAEALGIDLNPRPRGRPRRTEN
jgi:putative transposase